MEMTMEGAKFFHYKTKQTVLHKIPPQAKLALMIILALTSFALPAEACLAAYPALIIVSVALLGLTPAEAFSDNKPTIAYAVLLYAATAVMNAVSGAGFPEMLVPDGTYVPLLSRLALSLETTSIFYRTTSTGQFREGFASIERKLTGKKATPASDTLALALSFIPRIATFWSRIETAWKARGGADSIAKLTTLVPRFLQVSLREGYEKSLAIQNRQL